MLRHALFATLLAFTTPIFAGLQQVGSFVITNHSEHPINVAEISDSNSLQLFNAKYHCTAESPSPCVIPAGASEHLRVMSQGKNSPDAKAIGFFVFRGSVVSGEPSSICLLQHYPNPKPGTTIQRYVSGTQTGQPAKRCKITGQGGYFNRGLNVEFLSD